MRTVEERLVEAEQALSATIATVLTLRNEVQELTDDVAQHGYDIGTLREVVGI